MHLYLTNMATNIKMTNGTCTENVYENNFYGNRLSLEISHSIHLNTNIL